MKFSLYTVDTLYCDFLRKTDSCVPYMMDKKSIRPFVGIVFSVNGFNYYAPLTSPKSKHLHMKNQIDFLKIKDAAVTFPLMSGNVCSMKKKSNRMLLYKQGKARKNNAKMFIPAINIFCVITDIHYD